MFEFGRDLRRLFEKARDSHDLGWLELVGLNLVESEARSQSTDAGRISCPRPYEGWMRAAALWREHARRSGSPESLQRAEQAGRDAARSALNDDQTIRAAVDVGHTSMLAFDLYGAPHRLSGLLDSLGHLPDARRTETRAEIEALKVRLSARQARLERDAERMADTANRLTEVMQLLRPDDTTIGQDLQLDRAALSLEAGLLTRNAALLDRAGSELRLLVEHAWPRWPLLPVTMMPTNRPTACLRLRPTSSPLTTAHWTGPLSTCSRPNAVRPICICWIRPRN